MSLDGEPWEHGSKARSIGGERREAIMMAPFKWTFPYHDEEIRTLDPLLGKEIYPHSRVMSVRVKSVASADRYRRNQFQVFPVIISLWLPIGYQV